MSLGGSLGGRNLGAFRTALGPLLFQTCTLETAGNPADDTGVVDHDADGTFACFSELAGLPGGQALSFDPTEGYGYVVWARTDRALAHDDRITVDGLTLQIVEAPPPAGLDGLRRVECVKVS